MVEMNIRFQDKSVVVTGAASGIGRVTAQAFETVGAQVFGLDIQDSAGDPSEAIEMIACDVAIEKDVEMAFNTIGGKAGRVDILVNNAGIQTHGNVVDMTEALWDQTLNVNLKSAFLCAKYAIPLMETSSHGVIVNVSSAQSFVSQKEVTAYAVSKAGINALTRCIAIDYAPKIRCVAVCPGAVDTPMLERDIAGYDDRESIVNETEAIHLLNRISRPEEIAHFILFLASEYASFATGHAYRVDGGIGLKIEGT